MADYFTYFSFILPLKDDAQKQYALEIASIVDKNRGEETAFPTSFPDSLKDYVDDWTFDTEVTEEGLWLHSDCGGLDPVCTFVQHLLQKFDTTAFVSFEWSHDCSQPRTDAYGGGAAVITKTEIETMNTSDWIRSKTC